MCSFGTSSITSHLVPSEEKADISSVDIAKTHTQHTQSIWMNSTTGERKDMYFGFGHDLFPEASRC